MVNVRLLALSAAVALMPLPTYAQGARGLDDVYREVAGRLIGAALVDEDGYQKLGHLTTRIGNRLSGSANLEKALSWAAETMKKDGLENVTLQPTKVPRWVRGRESAQILAPVDRPLNMLGLGGSVATPAAGIVAPVVVVGSFDELEKLGHERIVDRIVLFDMPWEGYGRTVQYRTGGASRAARYGAKAVLVRSVTGRSLFTPHTGAMNYDPASPRIPAAAITVEDAAWIRRTLADGLEVRVRLNMEAQMMPDADSANVMGEITGRERPDEVVVLGGHIDSWDVGQGAHDDGGGILAAWQAVTLMKQLGLRPRRTVRVVGWTNEENGGRGGAAYRAALGANVRKHVAAIEMDGGAEAPVGFGLSIGDLRSQDPAFERAMSHMREIGKLLDAIGAGRMNPGGGGADIQPLMRDGVPGIGLNTVGEHYFDWHHTQADTFDKIDIQDFRKCVAALAVLSYILADMPETLAGP